MSGMYSERRARDDFAHSVFSDSDFDDNTSDGKDSEDDVQQRKSRLADIRIEEECPRMFDERTDYKKLLAKVNTRFLADDAHDMGATSTQAITSIKDAQKKGDANRVRNTDRADRATSEQVLDPRTRMILYKMLKNGVLREINGCLSTGKEANVYQGVGTDGSEYAVKIFKTSILVFKDRDRYVTGDYRFRKGYAKHNPRKMVQMWAEKEFRNLSRIHQAGIPSPEPLHLKLHVLVMRLIGGGGWAAPRLKDAAIDEATMTQLYWDCARYMRIMFEQCRLVHDVSQSVEHDHPLSLEFLRKDVLNITKFFRERRVLVLRPRELFDFVTNTCNENLSMEKSLELLRSRAEERTDTVTVEEEIDEEVFRQVFIPRSLQEVKDVERDTERIARGDTTDLFYTSLLHSTSISSTREQMNSHVKLDSTIKVEKFDCGSESSSTSTDSEGDETFSEESDTGIPTANTTVVETKEQLRQRRKENKRQVKEENREKRKTKVPKKVKKKKEKSRKR